MIKVALSVATSLSATIFLHFFPGHWPSRRLPIIDVLLTLLVSMIVPCLVAAVSVSQVNNRSWVVLGWIWTSLLFRQTFLALTLPSLISRPTALVALVVWHTSLLSLIFNLLKSAIVNEAKYEELFVVKKVEGEVLRLSPSTLAAPRGTCSICFQSLRPPSRQGAVRSLSLTRVRPRMSAGNLKCNGTNEVLKTNCRHYFHVACVSKWVKISAQKSCCPVCARPITT